MVFCLEGGKINKGRSTSPGRCSDQHGQEVLRLGAYV